MKKISFIVASAMLMAVSCHKEEAPEPSVRENPVYLRTLTVGVDSGQETRVGFDDNNTFYWQKGDHIGVFTTAGLMEMTLDDQYQKNHIGVFYGNFQEEFGEYVIYPYGAHRLENGQLICTLPSLYTYTSIAVDSNSVNAPMLGKINEGSTLLKHLASFFKIDVTNIPAGGEDMKLIFTADKRISGEFIADLSAETPVILTDDSDAGMVTINFINTEPGATGTFYIPAPLGTYGFISAEVMDGDILLASKIWQDQVLNRKTPKRGLVEVDYVAAIDQLPFGTLQDAIDAADNRTITLVKDVVLDSPLEIARGKTIVLDLNGKTVSQTATSASASYLMSVKGGGSLTIKNGTLSFAATTPDTMWGGEGQPPYPGYANNAIRNEGTLVIENAFIENKTQKGGASYVVDNYAGAKLTINEGSVLMQSGGDIAIRMFNGGNGTIDVTINGGTITGYRAVWVQLASNTTSVAPVMNLTVNGGTLTSTDQVYNQAVYSYSYGNDMSNVLINVNGGTFNGDIALTGGANKTNLETLNIAGGAFNGQWGFYSYGAEDKALDAITVTGGSFRIDPTDYLGVGYTAVQTEEGWVVAP